MKLSRLFLLFVFFAGFGVEASESTPHESHDQKWQVLKAQKPGEESRIPSEVIAKIKKMMENKSEDGKRKELTQTFLSVEVSLFDHHGVIDPPVKVIAPAGGGTVDMGRILPEGRAKFSLKIKVMGSGDKEVVPDQVFFIPRISEKKDGKELNCGKYFDVTHYFNKLTSPEGVDTYLTEGIYATSFLGTFVFVKKDEKELSLGHVNFVDGRFAESVCPKLSKTTSTEEREE